MSEGEQKERSFAVETSPHFVKNWRRIDAAIDATEVSLDIAKVARDDAKAAEFAAKLSVWQYEMSDLIGDEVGRALKVSGHELKNYSIFGTSFAGRLLHLTVLQPLESWQGDD